MITNHLLAISLSLYDSLCVRNHPKQEKQNFLNGKINWLKYSVLIKMDYDSMKCFDLDLDLDRKINT